MTRGATPSWWRSGRGDQEALFAAGWHALTSESGNDASIARARKEAVSAILRADGIRYDLGMEVVGLAEPVGPVDQLLGSADRLRFASRELATQLILVASGRVAASEAFVMPIAALIREDEKTRISLLPGSAPLPDPLDDAGPPPVFDAAAHGSELSLRGQSYVDTVRPYFSDTVRMYRWLLQEVQSGVPFETDENEAEAVIHFEYVYGLRPDWMLTPELHLLRQPVLAWELMTLMRHSIWMITAMGVTSPLDLWSMEMIDALAASRGLGDWVDE